MEISFKMYKNISRDPKKLREYEFKVLVLLLDCYDFKFEALNSPSASLFRFDFLKR